MPERRIEYMLLDDILGAAHNPKRHALGPLSASVTRFGYISPMELDERTGRLVAGHGRLDALRAMRERDENPPDGVTADSAGRWAAPVVRGWQSTNEIEPRYVDVAAQRWERFTRQKARRG